MTTLLGFVRSSARARAAGATDGAPSASWIAHDAAAYRRIVARQRRLGIRIASIVTVVLPAISLVGHLLAGTPFLGTAIAAVFLIATSALVIVIRGFGADR